MTKITQLPIVTTMGDQSVFVVVDNGVTKKLTYSTLKTTLKGDKGETGAQGLKGDTGEKGDKGEKGDTGAQGPVGPLAPFSTATDVRLGGIKIGSGITIDGQGVLSVPIVTITTATAIASGTVKPGTGLQLVDGNATMSVISRLYKSSFKEFQVSNQAASAYTFAGVAGSNPSLNNILPGSTIAFVLNVSEAHPFQLRLANGGSPVTEGQFVFVSNDGTITTGINANVGSFDGTLFWTVPDTPSQSVIYYQCTAHANMVGAINIKNDAQIIDGRITSELASISQNLIPDGNNTRYLGSDASRWHSLYVGPGSVDIGGVALSESSGQIVSSGGFFLGKSITNVGITTHGLYREAPSIVVEDTQGQDFAAEATLAESTVEDVIYFLTDNQSIQPSDTVSIHFQGTSGSGAVANPDLDYFIKDVTLQYKQPPTASIVFNGATTLNAQAQTVISDNAILNSLNNFLPYVQMCEDRDGLPTFLDPVANQTKALKIVDVDLLSGVVTFDISLAFATVPAATYVFEVPRLDIANGSYPILCEGIQIGRVDAYNSNYTVLMADKLDSARLPAGANVGDFVSVSCAGLTNSGQIGYYFLSSTVGTTQVNKTEVKFGVVDISLSNGGTYRNTAPTAKIYVNGQDSGNGASCSLAPAQLEHVTVSNFGSGYTPSAVVKTSPSDANVWQVVYQNQSETTGAVSGVSFYVTTRNNSQTISQGASCTVISGSGSTPGTVASVTAIYNTRDYRLYRVNMTQAASFDVIDHSTQVSFGNNNAVLTNTQSSASPVVPATTSTIGSVIVGDSLAVAVDGTLSVRINQNVPTHSTGKTGDKAGMIAVNSSYIYYCIADYTTGVDSIWKRVSLSNTAW